MLVKQMRVHRGKYVSASYVAFADPIKEMARIMFPRMPKRVFFGPSQLRDEIIPGAFKDGKPLTVRQLLIDIGTGLGRGYQDSLWLNNFEERFSRLYRGMVVVTDVRFRNEFEYLRKKGFYQIRLYRDTGVPTLNHISESGQDDIGDSEFDYVLHNNGKLADLRDEVLNQIIPRLKDQP